MSTLFEALQHWQSGGLKLELGRVVKGVEREKERQRQSRYNSFAFELVSLCEVDTY